MARSPAKSWRFWTLRDEAEPGVEAEDVPLEARRLGIRMSPSGREIWSATSAITTSSWTNWHQFTSECLTGSGQNGDLALWMLKDTAKSVLGANNWLRWNDFPKEDSVAKLPISTGQSLPQLPDVVKVISSVVDWATEREKRIQAEAQLDAEVKMQKMQTKAYAKELETHLKAFMKKLEANEHYIREQLEDRRQSRKAALIAIEGLFEQALRCIALLESPSSSEMPSHIKEKIVDAITATISLAAKAIEKFPSGPLATLD